MFKFVFWTSFLSVPDTLQNTECPRILKRFYVNLYKIKALKSLKFIKENVKSYILYSSRVQSKHLHSLCSVTEGG